MTKTERAISIVEDSRRTHVLWAKYQEKRRRAGKRPAYGRVGGQTFHRLCIRRYDLVLEVLRGKAR